MSRAGGDPEPLQRGVIVAASLSPDGRTLAFWQVSPRESERTAALWFASPPERDAGEIYPRVRRRAGEHASPHPVRAGRHAAADLRLPAQARQYDTVDIPLDGSPIEDVLSANRAEFSASRARDGRIVYVSNESGQNEIRVRATDGTDRAVVTPQDFPGEPDRARALMAPSVSPAGQRVLFARILRGQ